ncbi:S8 family serine peptidase [Streptomyces sp. NPDC048428]|uniref:S8 family peptidase n=1 Tax=Streptomyces sp. NPDC048428 TaxID=3154503 RepID=UPI0034122BB7
MRRRLRPGSVPAVLALTALTAAALAAPAGASQAGPPDVTALRPSADSNSTHVVRLITGDRVVVTEAGGKKQATFFPDSDSPTGTAAIVQHGGDITVTPREAMPLLDSGVLDPRLFDVGSLINQGYADGAELPLIVRGSSVSAPVPAASRQVRRLPALRATATRVEAAEAQKFWSGLRDAGDGASAKKLADGVQKVWLDGKVTPTLDRSVPQIGAPAAWAAGYDGKGVKVAVLDTGVDATHPDLSDRIDETRNFSDAADTVDRFGHGTHVASTIAGSGAAAGGKYKGVAPGTRLLIGKVLGDNGSGTESGVMAGMEWAAHSGAKVVSMSLGSNTFTDGTDPMSQALNALTEETGVLFVVAAGNVGPNPSTVGTPGAADAALTVAAVDKQDRIASFSSRGPRFGDNALKPDIAAPGVDIVAARAAGTSMGTPVDTYYTSANGTSMATPHVSGAAAIIAQEHPDWKAADIKGALMSSAKVLPAGAFAEGSGRVDLATAIQASVWATNASFGRYEQGTASDPVTRTVIFHNTGDRAVTLTLSGTFTRDGADEIAGALTLGSDRITVPAGGSQDVPVTLDPDVAAIGGTYTGTVTATGDGISAHATVALTRDLPTFKVGLKVMMPNGTAPDSSSLEVYNLRSNDAPERLPLNTDGSAIAQLKAGRYTVLGHAFRGTKAMSFVLPDINVTDHDLTLTADGRKAALIRAKTPQPSELAPASIALSRRSDEQNIGVTAILSGMIGGSYVLPSAAPQDGVLTSTVAQNLRSRPISARAQLPGGPLDLTTQYVTATSRFDGKRSLTAIDAGNGTEADLSAHDVTGKLALVRVGGESVYDVLPRLASAGASAVMLVNNADEPLAIGAAADVPAFTVPKSEGDKVAAALARRPVTVRLTGELTPSYVYRLVKGHLGAVPASQTYAPRRSEFADVRTVDYSPAPATTTDNLYTQASWMGVSAATGVGIGTPDERVLGTTQHAYLLAADTQWMRQVLPSGYLSAKTHSGPFTMYKAGTETTENWFQPVLHAGTGGDSKTQPTRTGDSMIVTIPKYVTGRSEFSEFGGDNADGDQTEFRAYQDGTLIGRAPNAWVEINNLPQEKSRYLFEMDAKRNNKWWSVSTEEHTAWSFSSAHVDEATTARLPLIRADYDLDDVALDSSVKARQSHRLAVSFRNADGTRPALTKAALEVSYDEGVTWRKVSDRPDGEVLTGRLTAPKGATGISLRIHAENASGSTIDQTVIHAVHVR